MQMLYAWYAAVNKLTANNSPAGERICLKIQEAFSSQVLRPEISELEIRNITQKTADIFIQSLHEDLRKVKDTYSISDTDWNNHIRDIATFTSDIETQRTVPLLLKVATAAGTYTSIKVAVPTISLISKSLTTRFASKAAIRATSSAGKLTSLAGKSLGMYVTIGFVAWDIIDHIHTKHVNAPILRQAISDYLDQLSIQIKQKIMGVISEIETDVATNLQHNH